MTHTLRCARTSIDSTAASVVVDVLDKLSFEGQAEERLYGAGTGDSARHRRRPGRRPARGLVAAFLVKALAMHGYRPELESCARVRLRGHRRSALLAGAQAECCAPSAEGETRASLHFSEDARAVHRRSTSVLA